MSGRAVGEEDAVSGLPDGDFGDVGNAEFARTGAAVGKGQVAETPGAVAGEEFEVASDVLMECCVKQADGGGGSEFEGANFAAV
jgi:hypothetical protein